MDHCQDTAADEPCEDEQYHEEPYQDKESDARFCSCFSFGAVRRGVCRAGGAGTGWSSSSS